MGTISSLRNEPGLNPQHSSIRISKFRNLNSINLGLLLLGRTLEHNVLLAVALSPMTAKCCLIRYRWGGSCFKPSTASVAAEQGIEDWKWTNQGNGLNCVQSPV